MGIIGGLTNLTSLLFRPVAGNLTDYVSKYKLSLVGAIGLCAACVGYVCSTGTWMIVLARILNGIGYSCCSVCMSTWTANMLPKDRVGFGMGLYGTMNALSMAVAPAIGVYISDLLGYRASFLIAAAFALGTLVTIQFIHDRGEPPVREKTAARMSFRLIDKNVVPVALIVTLFAVPYCATQSFLVRYVAVRGLSVSVGLFFPLYAVFLLALRFGLKNLFDKLPYWVFVAAGEVSAFLAMLCLTVMNSNFVMLLAALFMAGGYGIMCSVSQSTAILLAGEGHRGLANSTYYVGLDLGMSLGPMLGGVLYDAVEPRWFYPLLMLTLPLCAVVAVVQVQLAWKAGAESRETVHGVK